MSIPTVPFHIHKKGSVRVMIQVNADQSFLKDLGEFINLYEQGVLPVPNDLKMITTKEDRTRFYAFLANQAQKWAAKRLGCNRSEIEFLFVKA